MFAGDSIEEALSAAVGQLGTDLKVVDARKVRNGGVLGFFAKERYEVLAEPQLVLPPSASPPDANPLDATLRALVQEVETREDATSPVLGSPERPQSAVATPEPVIVLETRPSLFDFDAWDDVPAEPEPVVTPKPRRPKRAPAPEADDRPVWSRDALKDLGVPREILRRLPAEDPDTDLAWTAALERAIAAVEPRAGQPLGGDVRVVVNGDGMESVVDLLFAASEGYTPGTMIVEGREVAATPTWLALAVRACLPR